MFLVAGLLFFSNIIVAFILFFWFVNSVGPKVAGTGIGIGILMITVPFLMKRLGVPGAGYVFVLLPALNVGMALLAIRRNQGRLMRQIIPAISILIYLIVGTVFVLPEIKNTDLGYIGVALGGVLFIGGNSLLAFILYCHCHEPLKVWGGREGQSQ
ncbi:hypothetical protein GR183_16340 [Stappia sp. GBMRC 2046]|uniref:Uncharacterized protein n=1 Tax=Stappia sediminis TaxID=2692190 RepID=A0A7X3LWS7_9HYPH|nr:hypothetical protein [Stappia sediminis]MXN66486.1 hypothetical protein [Stappia sediminis]